MARGSQKTQRIVVVAGVVAIAGIVAFMAVMQVSNAQNVAFKQSWNSVKFKIGELTSQYQTEEGKWKAGQHSNAEMAGIVDQYLPRYQQLIDEANAIQTPERYLQARDLLVQSIEAEKESNVHFKNYLLTGDQQENRKASDLLSLSLKYELESSGAMSAAG